MSPELDSPGVIARCFLSYSHDDDTAMGGVASEIRNRIRLLYQAKTGRSLHIFVDREDIGWGSDWRESITASVRNATAFIPLITMNYFNREACREELMAYYSSANAIGVTQLVLPIVLAGAAKISATDAREEVRIIERLQFESLEEAWPRGFSSPEWMTALNKITDKLIVALEAAEMRIAELENSQSSPPVSVKSTSPDMPEESSSGNDSDESGVYFLMQEFGESSERFSEATPKLMEDLGKFSSALGEVLEDLNQASGDRAALRQKSILAAGKLTDPSTELEKSATEMLSYASAADGALRQIIATVNDFDLPVIRQSLNAQLDGIRGMIGDAAGGFDVTEMDQVVEMVKFVGSMNVSLRRSIQPGYRGVAAVRDAFKILLSWRDIPLLAQNSLP